MFGIDAQVVPFRTTLAVITALKSNDVQAAVAMLAPVMAQIKGGALKALAVTRTSATPGCPMCPPSPRAASRATRPRRGTASPRRRGLRRQ
jgi:tripartite-type tricarboxylate transporter receptor subunit TctC